MKQKRQRVALKRYGVERLRMLYAMLAGIPDNRVQLHSWVSGAYENRRNHNDPADPHNCGTIACAVGWATMHPAFKKQGLQFIYSAPAYKGKSNWGAVKSFFGLREDVAMELFQSGYNDADAGLYGTRFEDRDQHEMNERRIVMRRIRRLLLREGYINKARNKELALEEGMPE